MARKFVTPQEFVAENPNRPLLKRPRKPGPGPVGSGERLAALQAALQAQCAASIAFAVFEPNGPALWARLQLAVEQALLPHWQAGALLGGKPEQGFHVRCDATTHRQADLDAGRARCLVGIAPLKPAEFIVFSLETATASTPPA